MSQSVSHSDIAKGSPTHAPGESRLVRFADLLLQPLRNGVYRTKEFHGRGVKIVNMGELFGHPRLADIPMKRVELSSNELEKSQLRTGDLLFARRSLVAEGAGRCCLVKDIRETTTFESSIIRARPDGKQVLSEYLFYFFSSPQGRERMRTILRQVAVSGITGSDLAELKIPIPSLHTQRCCVASLGALDDRIELLCQTNATLEAIAQGLFKSWFVDFDPVRAKAEGREPDGMNAATTALFPDSFEDSPLGPIPQGWRVDEVGNVVDCVGGATPSTKDFSLWEPAEHHWVTPKDLSGLGAPVLMDTSRKVSATGLRKISSGTLPKGTLLLSSRAPIGYLAIAQIPTAINQGFIAMRPGGELPPAYLLFWTQWNMDSIKQKANGSTFMEISKSAFRPIKLCVPSEKIVTAFVSIAKPLLERIAANEAQRTQLTQLRDTLLPRLISGKLRLPDAQTLIEEATP
ncbi:restriction endonuclease subunit S [Rhodanobacter denitrificans]|nr:restriction endonuclease subunit S [Rhodanobacter denitrificans]